MKPKVTPSLDLLLTRLHRSSNERSISRTGELFRQWCLDRSCTPYPLDPLSLASFLVHRCHALKGSTKSIRGWISKIRGYSDRQGHRWLDREQLGRVIKIVELLEYDDVTPTRRMQPLTSDLLRFILSDRSVSLQSKAMFVVGHDALLRGAELCSGLRVSNLHWSHDRMSVSVSLDRSKTHRKGGPQLISIHDFGSLSGTSWLRKYFSIHDLWSSPSSLVFPARRKHRMMWDRPMTTSQLRSKIKVAITAIGLNPLHFSCHSFKLRAGGATDLFRANVFYPNIKKFGRWKSDAALIYYRDGDAVTKAAMEGFASLVNGKTVKSSPSSYRAI